MKLTPADLRAGDRAVWNASTPETVEVLGGQYIGDVRWIRIRLEDGGRLLTHPSHLQRIEPRPLLEVLAEHVAAMAAAR